MTIEILCTDLHEIWMKSEGVISKELFHIGCPPGGADVGRSAHTKLYNNWWGYMEKTSAC